MTVHAFKVEEEGQDLRLDLFLTNVLPGEPSRTQVQKIIDGGFARVNGKAVKAHFKLRVNDEIEVTIKEGMIRPLHAKAENIPLDVFYEDEQLLVVNKPAGMMVHPAPGVTTGTLVNALLYHCQDLSRGDPVRPGIVHRLDRETSGVLLVAKNDNIHKYLSRQFEQHRVKKRYTAIVKGAVNFDEGVVDAPLGRHPSQFDLRTVSFKDGAKEAKTVYRVIKRFGGQATMVALFPESGRTHQLRVHMRHLGHAILGDDKYGDVMAFPRLALHAQSVGFRYPRTGCWMEFSSVLPEEFLNYK
jgi:23S rRNA pseudouridine1911/1915/1917 synthase